MSLPCPFHVTLLCCSPCSWVDDQLAFNELVWHGFRNHLPERGIKPATPDGRVIEVSIGPEPSHTLIALMALSWPPDDLRMRPGHPPDDMRT